MRPTSSLNLDSAIRHCPVAGPLTQKRRKRITVYVYVVVQHSRCGRRQRRVLIYHVWEKCQYLGVTEVSVHWSHFVEEFGFSEGGRNGRRA